ncbi:MAG TPA: arsenosugar biosynthesis radical SAM (seleno)protein ArsS [Geobacteraceae bacterium]|nr:arsenosugar biosynthesis radical SAM (seleno)protein ArsS [Geobacteraceae bacterium]
MIAPFKKRLQEVNPDYLTMSTLQTLQVNLGNRCNLSCTHCHQSASPAGDRVMGREVMEQIAAILSGHGNLTLDMTGGTPEINPDFRYFVELTAGLSARRIVRSNLTIMGEPGMEWLAEFCREQKLVITASLPCYQEDNVDRQRGEGVHGRSIAVLQRLNSLGYGQELELNLVYNPGGRFLPGSQKELEYAYREELFNRYGITFNSLYTIANAPIGRFGSQLQTEGKHDGYMNLLASSFNPLAAANIMCRTLISIDWRGYLYNCDFNQALGLGIHDDNGIQLTVSALESALLQDRKIRFDQHCYCCTAGEGSSCTGALVSGR